MSIPPKRIWGPLVLGLALMLLGGVAWTFMWAGVDLAWMACNGSFAVTADNARCRWPAVYLYLGLGCFLCALAAFAVAVVRKVGANR